MIDFENKYKLFVDTDAPADAGGGTDKGSSPPADADKPKEAPPDKPSETPADSASDAAAKKGGATSNKDKPLPADLESAHKEIKEARKRIDGFLKKQSQDGERPSHFELPKDFDTGNLSESSVAGINKILAQAGVSQAVYDSVMSAAVDYSRSALPSLAQQIKEQEDILASNLGVGWADRVRSARNWGRAMVGNDETALATMDKLMTNAETAQTIMRIQDRATAEAPYLARMAAPPQEQPSDIYSLDDTRKMMAKVSDRFNRDLSVQDKEKTERSRAWWAKQGKM